MLFRSLITLLDGSFSSMVALMALSSAKAVVEKRVDFKTPFSDVPVVVVNANSATPNDVDVNAGSVDANGFSVFLYRGTNTNTHVAWLAVL